MCVVFDDKTDCARTPEQLDALIADLQAAANRHDFDISEFGTWSSFTAKERERCAKIAETMADWSEVADSSTGYAIAERIRGGYTRLGRASP